MKYLVLILFFILMVNVVSQEISVSRDKMNIGDSSYIDSVAIYNEGDISLLIDSIYCDYTNFLLNISSIDDWILLEDFSQGKNVIEIAPNDSILLRIMFAAVPTVQSNYTQIDTMYFYNNSTNMSILPIEITSTMITKVVDNQDIPTNYKLSQNYPNPFNPTTKITYTIASAGLVKIIVYDVLGRKQSTLVKEYKMNKKYEVVFNANDLPSGVYFYSIQTNNYKETKKMILLR